MHRSVGLAMLLLALMATNDRLWADERSEATVLLREALAAVEEAATASPPTARLRALEAASELARRLARDYAQTYVGLRLAAGQPIGDLDPVRLERELAELRSTLGVKGGEATTREPARARPAGLPRPCEQGVPIGGRRGETAIALDQVIADCRAALAFEPGSARWRFQLARALSERARAGDREEAVRLLEGAAADGWTPAKAELCARYYWGIGTAKDPARARVLCEAAAAEGSEQARALLARDGTVASARR